MSITATDTDDTLIGTDYNDTIDGLDGSDLIFGLAGDDERQGELLRQFDGRDLLQDHQVGTDLAGRLANPGTG